jgi:fluoroquinolone resistance protein
MPAVFFEDKTFDKVNYTGQQFTKGEYENCIFSTCDFSNTDLSNVKFTSCKFDHCNLSMAVLGNTAFKGIVFTNSKMLGLRFDHCSTMAFEITVDNCILNHSSFYKLKLKNTVFKSSHVEEVDFTECDLSGAFFDKCNLQKAIFENTLLEKSDFTTAYNYSLDPERNRLKKAKFSLNGVVGLLSKYNIEIDHFK